MSNDNHCDLGWVNIEGDHRQVGRALGIAGRGAVHSSLTKSEIWKSATGESHLPLIQNLKAETQARFPYIWSEIVGLAEGLELPVEQVMAWNCRGDILVSVPDGCTTVQIPGDEPIIAHNEDGLPFFRESCFVAELKYSDGVSFATFCYPGSLPGHTFAVTGTGLVQAVDNLRLSGYVPQIPRMVLGRAVLNSSSIEDALNELRNAPPSGGFHFTLAQQGSSRVVSAEFGTGKPVIRDVLEPSLHANHALNLVCGSDNQIITQSSEDRQRRGTILVSSNEVDPLKILQDKGGPGLPIRRDEPDDPDHENTLATAVITIQKQQVSWSIYDRVTEVPAYYKERVEF